MATYKINNEILEFNKIVYVDSINGNDTTGDGTKGNPIKTLAKGLTLYDGFTAYIMGVGEYNSVSINSASYDTGIAFIGQGQDTIFRLVSNLTTTNDTAPTFAGNLFLYNCIWRDVWQSTAPNLIMCQSQWSFHNVVFENIPNNHYSYFCPRRGTASSLLLNNCVKTNNSNGFFRADTGIIRLTNCYGAFTSGYGTTQSQWDYATNIITTSPLLDANYNILDANWRNAGTGLNPDLSQSHIGVYGGPTAWGNRGLFKNLIQSSTNLLTYTTTWEIVGTTSDNLPTLLQNGIPLPSIPSSAWQDLYTNYLSPFTIHTFCAAETQPVLEASFTTTNLVPNTMPVDTSLDMESSPLVVEIDEEEVEGFVYQCELPNFSNNEDFVEITKVEVR